MRSLALLMGILLSPWLAHADCSFTLSGLTPLSDMARTETYPSRGGGTGVVTVGGTLRSGPFAGGLYPEGSQNPPASHLAAAMAAGANVVPRLADGTPAPNGSIALASIGLSNTTHMFSNPPRPMGAPGCVPPGTMGAPCPAPPWLPSAAQGYTFKAQAQADVATRSELVVVDGALSGADAQSWATWSTTPNSSDSSNPWRHLALQLAAAGVSPAQLQVVWIKLAMLSPHTLTLSVQGSAGNFPDHAAILRDKLATIVHAVRTLYPNVQLVYLSSRMRAFTTNTGGNREPYAFESGFAVKWLIEDQIAERQSGSTPAAPVLLWGPYFWADSALARSDGRQSQCSPLDPFQAGNELLSDVRSFDDQDPSTDAQGTMYDFTHPGVGGIKKNADQLLAFFKTHITATSWFLGEAGTLAQTGMQPGAGLRTIAVAPVTIQFSAQPGFSDYAWDFDDGTQSRLASPGPKTFHATGSYLVRLTVTDMLGNVGTTHTTVEVVTSLPLTATGPTGPPIGPPTPTDSTMMLIDPLPDEPTPPTADVPPDATPRATCSSGLCIADGWMSLVVALVYRVTRSRRPGAR